jgi:Mg-chelatase subunit ChlD
MQVLIPLVHMIEDNKTEAGIQIDAMRAGGVTNLWNGIKTGLDQFQFLRYDIDNIPTMFVLTDGRPTDKYIFQNGEYQERPHNMLLEFARRPVTLHTFGFGYESQDGLLQKIAEMGGGRYSYIPEPGQMGTVFIHAVANMQSTFACIAVLSITYSNILKLKAAGRPATMLSE